MTDRCAARRPPIVASRTRRSAGQAEASPSGRGVARAGLRGLTEAGRPLPRRGAATRTDAGGENGRQSVRAAAAVLAVLWACAGAAAHAQDGAPARTDESVRPPRIDRPPPPAGGESDDSPAPGAAPSGQPAGSSVRRTRLARWIDVPVATLSTRYRFVQPTTGPDTNQVQAQEVLRVRLKVDPRARLSLTTGWQTGSAFTGGWDDTGIGAGDGDWNLQMRQLFVSAVPASGLQLHYGGLAIERGQASEITSYDNDGYCVGTRAIASRSGWAGLDEIIVTIGHLGDTGRPNVLDRLRRLDETNYQQVLVGRQLGARAAASLELARHEGIETVRAAARISTQGSRLASAIRLEGYVRVAGVARSGFAVAAERPLTSRFQASLGFASVDRGHDGLNADRFGRGRRVFATLAGTLTPLLSVQVFAQQSAGTPYAIPNRRRVDVILTYDAARHLRRLGLP